MNPMMTLRLGSLLMLVLFGGFQLTAAYQPVQWSDSLLERIRTAADLVPGARPTAVHLFRWGEQEVPESMFLENGADRKIAATYSVFQLVFPTGWIMVDAGFDPAFAEEDRARYESAQRQIERALRDALSTVVTHEHSDHVGTLLRPDQRAILAARTLLTNAQAQTLRERPDKPEIRLDPAWHVPFVYFDYDVVFALAPGVVLIRAPGHTPGSQMVYVRLASGREMLLIGDVTWSMTGVKEHRQKPPATSRELAEDRTAVDAQLTWLQHLTKETSVTIANSHDASWLAALVAKGALQDGLELK